jgi:hypothetical protein
MPLNPELAAMTTAAPVQATFSFSDIASGTGYETYYLIESEDSGGKDYHLTEQSDYSNSVKISQTGVGSKDLDYDLTPFTIPRTVDGDVLVSIPVHGTGGTTGGTWTVELYDWDGSSETLLGTGVVFNPTLSTAVMLYMVMPIDNKLIPVGHSLRCRVLMAMTAGTTIQYGIDPANRTDATLTITTTSKIQVPFKLDL